MTQERRVYASSTEELEATLEYHKSFSITLQKHSTWHYVSAAVTGAENTPQLQFTKS